MTEADQPPPGQTPPPPPLPPGYPPGTYPPPQIQYVPIAVPRNSGKAIAIMVLGIVSLVMFCSYAVGVIPAIIALAMARSARREIEASNGQIVGQGQLKAGVICSWVTVGLTVALVVALVIVFIVASANSRY